MLRFYFLIEEYWDMSVKEDKKFFLDLRKSIFLNSKRLLFDAEELFKFSSYPSASFLAICSLEESGKLYDVLVAFSQFLQGKLNKDDFLKRFRNHYKKQLSSFTPITSRISNTGKKIPKNISKLWGLVADNKLMTIRNNCIYIDIELSKKKKIDPMLVLKEADARYFIETGYEVLISIIESAFGHFWIDDSADVDIDSMRAEEELLVKRFDSFQKLKMGL